MNYRETANRFKNAITGNLRRTAVVGGAAVAMSGLVAAPAAAFGPHAGSADRPAAVAQGTGWHSTSHISGGHNKAHVKAPSAHDMNPRHITAHQTTYKPNASQMRNARAIIAAGQERHLPPRAWVIALATSSQETNLHNYGKLKHNDHDSLGLFQQRPSSGWGKANDLVDPEYAAGKFYNALTHVHNWKKLPVTVAAQKVQVSAFPDRYAQWEKQAANLILATYGQGPYAHVPGAQG